MVALSKGENLSNKTGDLVSILSQFFHHEVTSANSLDVPTAWPYLVLTCWWIEIS